MKKHPFPNPLEALSRRLRQNRALTAQGSLDGALRAALRPHPAPAEGGQSGKGRLKMCLIVSCALALTIHAAPSNAQQTTPLAHKAIYRNITADPSNIWTPAEIHGGAIGATIHEYQADTPTGRIIVSQIVNDDCTISTCPTRIVRIAGGARSVLATEDLQQVVPFDRPSDLETAHPELKNYREQPFTLSGDTLRIAADSITLRK